MGSRPNIGPNAWDQREDIVSTETDDQQQTGATAAGDQAGVSPGQPEVEAAQAQDTAAEAGEQINPLQAEVDDLKEKLLMAHAEMQNVRRRAERDVENAHKYALDKFVGDLVAVVDNLERALAAIDTDNEAMNAVNEGIELTLKNFLDVLKRHKVEQLDPKGQPFDPEKHQAMTMVPNPEVAANTVIDVFQKGYLLNGRLVRPAMVVVSRGD
jgi:molecular chaperone GrpE